ncbi:MAG: sulfite exporter TauE/SafE family protein [Ilumatobacteraceae bacterium]
MTLVEFATVACAVFFASFVQAIAGFGFGLLAVPLMSLAIAPKRAVVISALVGVLITTWQAWSMRRDADRPVVKRMTIAAYVGMPFGLVVLITFSNDALRLLLGIAVLVATAVLATNLRVAVGPHADYVAGFVSGVLNTSLSTNGPPLAVVLQARRLDAPEFRATISTVFALSNAFALVLFIASGKVTRSGLVAAALAAPALALGQALGYPIRRHVHGARFRVLVLLLLAAAGISAIVAALR